VAKSRFAPAENSALSDSSSSPIFSEVAGGSSLFQHALSEAAGAESRGWRQKNNLRSPGKEKFTTGAEWRFCKNDL